MTFSDASLSARVAARYKKRKKTEDGNTVYLYSERQIALRNSKKAERLEKLRKNVHKLRARVKKDLASKDPETALIALVVGLMDHTAERVGNDESAEQSGHFGVTGWQKGHVSFSKGKATVKYVGKSGVKQKKVVTDKALVTALKETHSGCENGDLFCHDGGKITATKVNGYLKKFGGGITAKDLRGLHANSRMQEALKAARKAGGELPSDPKKRKAQLKKEWKKALEETAADVGHEPSTLNSQYLVPGLEEEFMKGRVMDKMVKTAIKRKAKAIDKSTVDRWRKDLRIMTKIYRGIDADFSYGADEQRIRDARVTFDQARKLFRNFRDNFEEWVYKELLPKVTSDDPETFMEKEIRKSAWDLRYVLDDYELFPVFRPGREPDWAKFRQVRDRNIKRYQVKATKAFKDIAEYLDMKPEARLDRRDPVEHMEVGGVHVVVNNFGRDSENQEDDLEAFLRNLRGRIAEIKRAGFPGAVKDLTVTVDFDSKQWDVNGQYSPASDTLSMFPIGLVGAGNGHGTFIHECGHRFYYKELSVGARNHWEEVMSSRSIEITQQDVNRFSEAVARKVNPEKLWDMMGDDDRMRAALPLAESVEDEPKFRELSRLPLMPWDSKVFDLGRYRKLLESRVGERVQIEEITEYGNTNPMEAFAEVFRLWVQKGPRAIKPWTREFFGRICRSGGAKLASVTEIRVVERFIAAAGAGLNP